MTGTSKGSGKIMFGHYNKLVQIWVALPLSFGVDVGSFTKEQESSSSKRATSSVASSS